MQVVSNFRARVPIPSLMRRRRKFNSKRAYDLCFRAVRGLPLPARLLTQLLIQSAMARTLALTSVIICNYVWMPNHPHMQLYSLDMQSFSNFHGQLKKRLTDYLKRLLCLDRLNLWIDRTTAGEILDLDAAIARIVYAFTNPVRALLAKSIDEFKGCSTWKEFLSAEPDVNAFIEKEVPWVLATDIEPLSNRNPSAQEEHHVISDLEEKAELRKQVLRVYPFKWLEQFGITDPVEIEKIRQQIIMEVRAEEAIYANKKRPPQRLEGYLVTDEYLPPKKERSVFMYGSTPEVRIASLRDHDRFSQKCRECFLLLKKGYNSIPWPPGCFIPPSPRLCSPIG